MTSEREEELVQWVLEGQKVGAPKSIDDIKNGAWALSDEDSQCRKFGVNGPSNGFLDRFINRHPNLSSRKPEGLGSAAANVTKTNLINWFDHVENYLRENNLLEVLDDPRRVFNCDEAGFVLNPVGRVVIAEKNSKDVHRVLKNEKEQLTVLYTFSADGFTYDPFIVYPGVRLNKDVKNNIPDGINHTMTASGWMTSVAFCYFLKQFAQQARARSVSFPIVLFLDGHKSHEGLDVARVAREEKIILVRLYPNATSYYQPADKGIFKPIKSLYEKFVKFNRTFNDFVPSKQNFASILKRIHSEINPDWVITSFEVCGIYPFNKNAINYSRLKTHDDTENYSNEIVSDDSGISNDSFTQLLNSHAGSQSNDFDVVVSEESSLNSNPVPPIVVAVQSERDSLEYLIDLPSV